MGKNTPSFKNSKYEEHYSQIETVKDIYSGVDKASGHLQKYNRETADDYKDRQKVCTLNNFVKRVVESYRDIVFRYETDVSELENTAIAPYIDTIDFTNNINTFAKNSMINYKRDGSVYILVDSPMYDENIKTKRDEQEAGVRPYMTIVDRNSIINWKLNTDGSFKMITMIEKYTEEDGAFAEVIKSQYRVFYDNGIVEIWRDDELFETIQTKNNYVPIVKIGNDDVPALYDLARLNINHMNRSSELNNYIRICGAPVPVMYGNNNNGEVQVIGVNQGISFSGTPSEAGFEWVEMSGGSASIIREQMKHDEESMLDIAVNLVASNQPRTATEVNADNIENESKLTNSAQLIEEGINKALEMFANYLNSSLNGNGIKVNKDFNTNKLTPNEVAQYRNDYINGIISWEKLIDVLIAGEVYPKMDEAEKTTEKARLIDSGEI